MTGILLWYFYTIQPAGLLQGIMQQTGDRHRPDTSRNRRNRTGDFADTGKFNIANQFGASILFLDAVDADIDHRRTRFDPVAFDHFRAAYSSDENIGLAAFSG